MTTKNPFTRALTEHVGTREYPGTRWTDLADYDRERLCCLYAAEVCQDTLLTAGGEEFIWRTIAETISIVRDYDPAIIHSNAQRWEDAKAILATRFAAITRTLSDHAMDQCEHQVRRIYIDAWQAEHDSDLAERQA